MSQLISEGSSFSGHEANCCFLNTGDTHFADVSAVSGLNFTDDGRAIGVCDWDFDGALDLWIANRTGPQVRLMRNGVAPKNRFVAFRLQGKQCNRDAIGARVELEIEQDDQTKRIQTVHAGDGFLSQSSKWVHFGLSDAENIRQLKVHWPGGKTESFTGISPGKHYLLLQGSARVEPWTPPLDKTTTTEVATTNTETQSMRRVVLTGRFPMPSLRYELLNGKPASPGYTGHATLINLWSTTCAPCIRELKELEKASKPLLINDIKVLALNTDPKSSHSAARSLLERIKWPYDAGFADEELVQTLDIVQRITLGQRQPMPLPTSFLVDSRGHLAAIYFGALTPKQVLADWQSIRAAKVSDKQQGLPFSGWWRRAPNPGNSTLMSIVAELLNAGLSDVAKDYLSQMHATRKGNTPNAALGSLAQSHLQLASLLIEENRQDEAIDALRKALRLQPKTAKAHVLLGKLLKQGKEPDKSFHHFQQAVKAQPDNATAHLELGMIYTAKANAKLALYHLRKALEHRPDWIDPMNILARILAMHPDPKIKDLTEATRLAKLAVKLTNRQDLQSLETLSTVYASAKQFAEAIEPTKLALALATQKKDQRRVLALQKRLQAFRRMAK